MIITTLLLSYRLTNDFHMFEQNLLIRWIDRTGRATDFNSHDNIIVSAPSFSYNQCAVKHFLSFFLFFFVYSFLLLFRRI